MKINCTRIIATKPIKNFRSRECRRGQAADDGHGAAAQPAVADGHQGQRWKQDFLDQLRSKIVKG